MSSELKEEWKDVPGYEGWYQVSDKGRVKSLDRTVKHGKHKEMRLRERIRKLVPNRYGYLTVQLHRNGEMKLFKVHQLVCMAFLNHTPNGYELVVDHIDNSRDNNRLGNLRIITHRENTSRGFVNTSSKYTGVYWNKRDKKWQSYIRIKGKLHHLGCFDDEKEAHKAYQNKRKELEALKH